MSDTNSSWQQGQNDAAQNYGPAQTHTWDADNRAAYDTGYQQGQNEG